jgi:hypothetical protein
MQRSFDNERHELQVRATLDVNLNSSHSRLQQGFTLRRHAMMGKGGEYNPDGGIYTIPGSGVCVCVCKHVHQQSYNCCQHTHTAEHVRPTIGWTDDEGIGVEQRAFHDAR